MLVAGQAGVDYPSSERLVRAAPRRGAPEKASDAAAAMRVSAQDLLALGVIDEVIAEPVGGAHRAPEAAIAALGARIEAALQALAGRDGTQLRDERRARYLGFAQAGTLPA